MIKKYLQVSLFLVLTAVMLITTTGCGPKATDAPVEATSAPATGGKISENVATYAVGGDMPALDPPYMLARDTIVGFNVYETLTLWSPDEGIIPALATEWESNEDGTVWNFKLRNGVKFHDGSTLNANDVKASLDRNIAVGMVAYDFVGVESIEVVDDLTVRFTSSAPRNMPLILTASYGMFIYTSEAAEKNDSEWFNTGNDAGSGPYTIASYEPGKSVVLNMFPDYWGGWQEGQFTQVVLSVVEDPTVRDQMIRSGDADITMELPFDSLASLEKTDGLTILPFKALAFLIGAFDLNKAPLNNLKVRQALVQSYPYEDVQQAVFLGNGEIPKGFGTNFLWNPPEDFPRWNYDQEAARILLKDAGMENGFELKAALMAGSQEILSVAELWKAELAKLNITLDVQQLSSGAFWDYAYNPDNDEYHIFLMNASGDIPALWPELICFTSTPYGWMPFIQYKNPKFDELVFEAWAQEATDAEAAHSTWVEAQRILHDDAVSVFMLDFPYVAVFKDSLVGYQPNEAYVSIVFFYDLRRQ